MHYCEGGYERIAPKLLKELNVDCYYVSFPRTQWDVDDIPQARSWNTTRIVLGTWSL